MIFEAFRAIGYISDGTPFSVHSNGTDTFVTVSVGKAWQALNCSKLSLVCVGEKLNKSIKALVAFQEFTFAATGRYIAVFDRSRQVGLWKAHQNKVILLLRLGMLVLSVDAKGHVCVWDINNTVSDISMQKPADEFHLDSSFTPTCVMHPDTYIDKVLFGSEEGRLQLWNFRSKKMIHEFKGWSSPVRTCVSSPALDVVAVGCADGKIYVHNIRYDETIVTFAHTSRGPVTALSFRTDDQPLLAAGGSTGSISIWNLEKKKLQTVINDAHDSDIGSLHFLASEPVLLSNSKDNSLKMWIFDSPDGEARLLRYRSGHSAPPACIRYYGDGRCILSAGHDRAFRVISTIQDQQSKELSQGHVAKRAKKLKMKEEELKLPPIICLDAAEIRERDWCNVVTCHLDDCAAYTWRLQNYVIGEHVLRPCRNHPSPVKACSISACGNFVVLGTASGCIERFNLQSGILRGSYCDPSLDTQAAHAGAVNGLASDAINALLFSAGYDKLIKVWDFKTLKFKSSMSVDASITKMTYHRGNGLAAVASDDHALRLYDLVALRLVRVFKGHTDRITDMCFSDDGKWLLSSSMDATVRIWDVVAARPLDAMRVDSAVTALGLSPSMDMLATCHVNHNGVYLWANKYMYSGLSDSEIVGSGNVAVDASLPSFSSVGHYKIEEIDETAVTVPTALVESSKEAMTTRTSQITPELVTLSFLPKAQWQSLVNLETIKVRNKPTAAPQKPEKAPFFLPSVPSLSGIPTFAVGGEDSKPDQALVVRSAHEHTEATSAFTGLLQKFAESGNCLQLLEHLKSMTPSSLDAEVRILQIVDEDPDAISETVQQIKWLLDFLISALSKKIDFDFVQAVTLLVLKVHGESLSEHPELREKAAKLRDVHGVTWKRLDSLFQRSRCIVSFLSDTAM